MSSLIAKIDEYLMVEKKREAIYSNYEELDLESIIEKIKESDDPKKIIDSINENMKKEVMKLIEGGLL